MTPTYAQALALADPLWAAYAARYAREGHPGDQATPGDWATAYYRYLSEGWSAEAVLQDAEWPGTVVWPPVVEPPPPPPVGDGMIRAGFLLTSPYGYGYPGWAEPQRTHYRAWMRGLGLRHLPMSPWCSDPRAAIFDFRPDPTTFRARCLELLNEGITPIVMAYTGDHGARDWSRTALERFWAGYAAALDDLPELAFCTGWEINDINAWTRSGAELGAWARRLARLVERPVWVHWTPERWSGWPDYGGGGEQDRDEYAWWREFGGALRGILYQDAPDKPLADVLDRAFTIPAPHGYRPGIAGRIVDGCGGQRFVLFEFAREMTRWKTGVEACERYAREGLCHGWG